MRPSWPRQPDAPLHLDYCSFQCGWVVLWIPQPYGSKYPNTRYLPPTIVRTPNLAALNIPTYPRFQKSLLALKEPLQPIKALIVPSRPPDRPSWALTALIVLVGLGRQPLNVMALWTLSARVQVLSLGSDGVPETTSCLE